MNTPTPPLSHSDSNTEDSDTEIKEEVDETAGEELKVKFYGSRMSTLCVYTFRSDAQSWKIKSVIIIIRGYWFNAKFVDPPGTNTLTNVIRRQADSFREFFECQGSRRLCIRDSKRGGMGDRRKTCLFFSKNWMLN